MEPGQHCRTGLDEDRSGAAGIDLGKVMAQHPGEELNQRTGRLDTGRARAGDDEREQPVVDQRWLHCRPFETAQHVVP